MNQRELDVLKDAAKDVKDIVKRMNSSVQSLTEDITVKAVLGIYSEALVITADRILAAIRRGKSEDLF